MDKTELNVTAHLGSTSQPSAAPLARSVQASEGGPTMKEHVWPLTAGINRSREFARKKLATHTANVGLICGHGCLYCSSRSVLRCHRAFKVLGLNPFDEGYCIVDPQTPLRLMNDVHKTYASDVIMFCSTSDGWAPEAQSLNLGEQCLRVLLEHGRSVVRVLTKNAAVTGAYDLMARYRNRVRLGLSLTAPKSAEALMKVLEPHASTISERFAALKEAHERGLRTYGMFCPCLPGIADSPEALEEMFAAAVECGTEDIWLEPVNARGKGIVRCAEALAQAGFTAAAHAADAVRHEAAWNEYAINLVKAAQVVAVGSGVIDRLHVLLYANRFTSDAQETLNTDPRGIVWLKKQ